VQCQVRTSGSATAASPDSVDSSSSRNVQTVGQVINDQHREFQGTLTLVIPMFRESHRIARTVEVLARSTLHRPNIVFCFVDDASPDDTVERTQRAIAQFELANTEILVLDRNIGKGGAVRSGILHVVARADIVGYLDADLSLDPGVVLGAVTELQRRNCDAVVGSRVVDPKCQPKLRRLASLAFQQLVRLVAPTGVSDSQCAMKLFRSDVARLIFEPLVTSGFAFDVELLARLRQQQRVVHQVAIVWEHQAGSSVGGLDCLRMLRELFEIRSALRGDTGRDSMRA
jgi:dolichyl-phosphate beta-glucosyltransferase